MRFRRRGVRAENQRAGRPGVLMRKLLPAREPCSAAEIASSPSQLCRRSPRPSEGGGGAARPGKERGLHTTQPSPTPQHLGETPLLFREEGVRVSARARLGSGPDCWIFGRQRQERGRSKFPPLPSAHFRGVQSAHCAEVLGEVGPCTVLLRKGMRSTLFLHRSCVRMSLSMWSHLKFSRPQRLRVPPSFLPLHSGEPSVPTPGWGT